MGLLRHWSVEGRHVLITGAARGIGREAATRLARRGAKLSLLDINPDGAERAAAELSAAGAEAEPFVADVADRDGLAEAIGAARKRLGPVHVTIANAGIAPTPVPAIAMSDEEFERVVSVNLLGVWRTLKLTLPDVVEKRGYLLPIASLAAGVPVPFGAPYGASKSGVHSLARTLRMELAHTGAKVGCAYFGFIDTDMTTHAFENPELRRARRGLPGVFSKVVPVGDAGEAIARGVERRSKRVVAPRWVTVPILFGGLGGPLEGLAAREPRLVRALRSELAIEETTKPEIEEVSP